MGTAILLSYANQENVRNSDLIQPTAHASNLQGSTVNGNSTVKWVTVPWV